MAKKKIILILVITLACVSFFYYRTSSINALGKENNNIGANGTLEFTEISISTEIGGKIEKLLFEEGDNLKSNQLISVINSETLNAQLLQSKANLQANKSRLAGALSGARKQEIDQARAGLNQSEA